MTDAPKRIWLDTSGKHGRPYVTNGYLAAPPNTEYTRADIADELLEALKGVKAVLHDAYAVAYDEMRGLDVSATKSDDRLRAWKEKVRAVIAKATE